MTDLMVKWQCHHCQGPITDGDQYDYVLDGFPLYFHVVCPEIIEPVVVDEFIPPFLKVVRIIFDFIGKEV